MDQNLDSSPNDFLWALLENPANDAASYAYNLHRLVNDFPQSGILQALLAHASEEKNLKRASAYFSPRALFKLINAPSTFTGVPDERIFIQPGISMNGGYPQQHQVIYEESHNNFTGEDLVVDKGAPPVLMEEPTNSIHEPDELVVDKGADEYLDHIAPAEEHLEHVAEGEENLPEIEHHTENEVVAVHEALSGEHETVLGEHETAGIDHEAITTEHEPAGIGHEVITTEHETPVAAQPAEEVHTEAEPDLHHDHIAAQPEHFEAPEAEPPVEHENVAEVSSETASTEAVSEHGSEIIPEHAHVELENQHVTEEPVHDDFGETPEQTIGENAVAAMPEQMIEPDAEREEPVQLIDLAEAETHHEEPAPVLAEANEQHEQEPAIAVQHEIKPEQVPTASEDADEIYDEIVGIEDINVGRQSTGKYFTFDEEFGAHGDDSGTEREPAAVIDEMSAQSGAEQQDVSKYHDEKMPYTFMWWLDKTRKEHAQVYQPYIKPPAGSAKKTKKVTDELQQQYFENIFHITSVEELDKSVPQPPAAPDGKRKEQVIIERFIKEEPQIKPQSSDKLDNENKAKKSSEDRDELVSETLAAIYSDQMLYHKAIASYKKLMLKFPEKSRYFAGKIEQLEKKTN